MSIDAKIETVFINEDGSGYLALIDRPKDNRSNYPGCAGQKMLRFETAPEEIMALNGLLIWGSSETIMLGEKIIAKRLGYTRIEFVCRAQFVFALNEYKN